MRFRIAFLYAVFCASLITQAQAQEIQPPNNTDLKAAYCIGATQQNLADMSGLPESIIKGQQDQLQHLQAYLLPRMQFVDPVGLGAARTRGQTDSNAVHQPDMTACGARCFAKSADQPASDAVAALKQCTLACDTEHRLPRLWSCNDLSWLPF